MFHFTLLCLGKMRCIMLQTRQSKVCHFKNCCRVWVLRTTTAEISRVTAALRWQGHQELALPGLFVRLLNSWHRFQETEKCCTLFSLGKALRVNGWVNKTSTNLLVLQELHDVSWSVELIGKAKITDFKFVLIIILKIFRGKKNPYFS